MATLNSEKTVGRAIESFLSQSHSNKELVVADGLSSDKTSAAVEAFNSEIVSMISQLDCGIYDGLNKGIQRATGDVIGLLHSNDFFVHEGVLTTIASAFEDPELDAVYADVVMFPPDHPDRVVRRYNSGRFELSKLKFGLMPAHPTLYLRRRVFDRYGFYEPTYRISGDFEFVGRIFKDGALKSVYFNEVWMRMQTGGASTGGLRSKYLLNAEIIRACRSLGIRTNWGYLLAKYPMKLGEILWQQRA